MLNNERTAYCVECGTDRSFRSIHSFTSSLPSLDYCTSCNRAYVQGTEEPLMAGETDTLYFDRNFMERDEWNGTERHCRIVTRRQDITPAPSVN